MDVSAVKDRTIPVKLFKMIQLCIGEMLQAILLRLDSAVAPFIGIIDVYKRQPAGRSTDSWGS